MVAMSYLPAIEIGRRRRRVGPLNVDAPTVGSPTAEELEKRRRDRRKTRGPIQEEDEPLDAPLRPGEVVSLTPTASLWTLDKRS